MSYWSVMDAAGSTLADGSLQGEPPEPFWRSKSLTQMSAAEWESLCDGCGRCCLVKLEDEENGEILFTRVACRLLEISTCRCRNYAGRSVEVPQCLDLRAGFTQFHWLPRSCAYRLLSEGRELPPWHPLITGDRHSTHRAGLSVRDFAIPEGEVDDVEDFVIEGFG